ncbi:MAG TPA: GNAT family N-acetyltransferase [Chitinophagales bacterium]|nr:GNAT family N-acetyltransferase [Chitinophagales bacterium]
MQNYKLAGAIMGEAFYNYPLMLHAFKGYSDAERAKRVNHLYTSVAATAIMYGGLIVTPDEQGAITWLSGKHFPLGLYREIKSGMATLPIKLGLKPTNKLVQHDNPPEAWIRKNAGEKMGYIWTLGVRTAAQGKGLSRQLIEQSITDMRAQGLSEFWLKTEDSKNVTIYQKIGFEVVNEILVKSSGIKSWAMWRE